MISYKGNCDIIKIKFLNRLWRNSKGDDYEEKYENILDKLWNSFKNIL